MFNWVESAVWQSHYDDATQRRNDAWEKQVDSKKKKTTAKKNDKSNKIAKTNWEKKQKHAN